MRLSYLDNLRAILMVLGVVLHTCAAFSPKMYWVVTYQQTLPWVEAVNEFIHIFRMPLFFMISGFFAYVLMQKQTRKKFFLTKALRIAVPFLTVLIVLNFPQLLLVESLQSADNEYQIQNTSLRSHLWFLVNLLFYFVIYIMFHPLIIRCKGLVIRHSPTATLTVLVVVVPVVYLFVLALNKFGIPIYTDIPILGSVFILLSYFDYFIFGAFIACMGHDNLLSAFRSKIGMLAVLVVSGFSLTVNSTVLLSHTPFEPYFQHLQAILLSLIIWRLGQLALNSKKIIWSRFSEASYSIYLFHHLLIVIMVIFLNHLYIRYSWAIDANILFALLVTFVLTITIVVHRFIVAPFPILSLLFNGKSFKAKVEVAPEIVNTTD